MTFVVVQLLVKSLHPAKNIVKKGNFKFQIKTVKLEDVKQSLPKLPT